MTMVMAQPWSVVVALLALLGGLVAVFGSANKWAYAYRSLDREKRRRLPPGDFGWPVIGNMFAFLLAFKSDNPDSFIASFVKRYGRTGIYRAFMFGCPTIILTTPETCKKVLMNDKHFTSGWPRATVELMGKKSFVVIGNEEHKRLKKMTAAPINGYEALSTYLKFIEKNVVSALDKWSGMGNIEFLTELRRLNFRVIVHIFFSSESDSMMEELERIYTDFNHGLTAMTINLPGFAYQRALKARRTLVKMIQSILTERRASRAKNPSPASKDLTDNLIETVGENGTKLSDAEIIDVLVMYLNAGHASGNTAMWASVLIQEHPEVLKKAKKEQEEIRRNMPSEQKGLMLKECRKMEYLSKIIDETLRLVNVSFVTFREATDDVDINGYLIPKGWKVQAWLRSVHLDPLVHPNPKEFNPSRWDGGAPKPGTLLPFGAGGRFCPGYELAKIEISVFLHHFLLGYEVKRQFPGSPVEYLPNPSPTDNCIAKITKVPKASI